MKNDDFMNFVGYQQYGGGSDPGLGGGVEVQAAEAVFWFVLFCLLSYAISSAAVARSSPI